MKQVTIIDVRNVLGNAIVIATNNNKKLYYNPLTCCYYIQQHTYLLPNKFTCHEVQVALDTYNSLKG